jgi:hypothetical protein
VCGHGGRGHSPLDRPGCFSTVADGTRRDAEVELHAKFCGDPLLTPGRIVAGHLANQVAEGEGQARAPDAGPPAPEEADRLPVPADQGCRLDDRERFPPGEAQGQQASATRIGLDARRAFTWRSRWSATGKSSRSTRSKSTTSKWSRGTVEMWNPGTDEMWTHSDTLS